MSKFHPVTHVIFDMDGLLLDTETKDEIMVSSIAEKYGKKYTDEIKLKALGTTEQATAECVVSLCGLPITAEEFIKEVHLLQAEHFGQSGFMPGAERLVRHLHDKGIPIAVATSSSQESVAIKTKNVRDVFDLFHHIVMGSSDPEIQYGKPAPDIFRICASRFDDKPAFEKCLVFEDSPNGVTGARAANMQAVMVPDPLLPAERTKHATQVIQSLLDFNPEDFGLPAF